MIKLSGTFQGFQTKSELSEDKKSLAHYVQITMLVTDGVDDIQRLVSKVQSKVTLRVSSFEEPPPSQPSPPAYKDEE